MDEETEQREEEKVRKKEKERKVGIKGKPQD